MKFDKNSLTLRFDDIEEISDLIEDEWDINDGRGMSGIRKELVDLLERDALDNVKFVKLSVEAASVDLVTSKEREKELERKLKEYKKEHRK